MKILVISQYFWPENFRINDLVSEWKKSNYEVEILTGKPNFPSGKLYEEFKINKKLFSNYEGFKVHRVPIFYRGSGSRFRLLINYFSFLINATIYSFFKLRKKKYDIIFTFGTSPVTIGLIGIFLSKFTRSKNVIWLLDLWPDILFELKILKNKILLGVLKIIINYIYKNNDLIFAQSNSFKEVLKKIVKLKKLKILHSWPEKINYEIKEKSKEIEFRPDKLNIIFAGTIGETQNFEDIVEAFKLLKDENVRLIVLGDGRKKDWLENQIKIHRIENIILMQNKPLKEVPFFISHADVLFFSLKSGKVGSFTIPGKLSTYLNFNKPILCHAQGESQNIIKENNFGLTSDPGDLNLLIKNIRYLNKLKKDNMIKSYFNQSFNYKPFSFKSSFINLTKSLNEVKSIEIFNKIKLITEINKIPFEKNFILSALNLAYLGFLCSGEVKTKKNIYHWPDGIFSKRFFKSKKINKISGRKLLSNLIVPKSKNVFHVIGNMSQNSENYLKSQFNLEIKFTPLPYANNNELVNSLPKINQNEVVLITLPTPKQEFIAEELSKLNENFSILCIGGALNMLSGDEPSPPKALEENFEFIWRLRFDTRRRLVRLIKSSIYYIYGEVFNKFKKYKWELYND
ncbi:MAG: glycosyltransferase [Candidatus Pelagibacter sp.]